MSAGRQSACAEISKSSLTSSHYLNFNSSFHILNSLQLNPTKIHTVLSKYLPAEVVPDLVGWIVRKNIHFTVAQDRKSKLGDYRTPFGGKGHRISVNGSLNKYAFLITFLHEIAHLLTFEEFKNRVNPHGKEWKRNFQKLVKPYLANRGFPERYSTGFGKLYAKPSSRHLPR